MMKAGVIGLGEIGGGVAQCLQRAGRLAAVCDVSPEAREPFRDLAPICATPAELARQSDAVIVAVVNAAQTVAVLNGPEGVLSGARPGLSVILLATLSLEDLNAVRAMTDAAGVILIDSGVVGGRKAAENGLICLVGADADTLEPLMPVFNGFARYVAHMGGPGSGMTAKIIYNAIYIGSLRAGHECAALARAVGVNVARLSQVFKDSADSVGGPLLFEAAGDPQSDPAFRAQQEARLPVMLKDLQAALDMAETHGIEMPMVKFCRETAIEILRL
jgi:3-hydroxyisobutyrate dehydrogenase-like beta-hydroxyacid dehydrogenase